MRSVFAKTKDLNCLKDKMTLKRKAKELYPNYNSEAEKGELATCYQQNYFQLNKLGFIKSIDTLKCAEQIIANPMNVNLPEPNLNTQTILEIVREKRRRTSEPNNSNNTPSSKRNSKKKARVVSSSSNSQNRTVSPKSTQNLSSGNTARVSANDFVPKKNFLGSCIEGYNFTFRNF